MMINSASFFIESSFCVSMWVFYIIILRF